MTDITERLRQNARSEDCFTDPYPDVLTDAADEIDRLRAHVADTDGAITVLGFQNAELRARVAELIEAARNASATLSHAYHTTLTGQLAENAHEDYQRLDAALARIGGDK